MAYRKFKIELLGAVCVWYTKPPLEGSLCSLNSVKKKKKEKTTMPHMLNKPRTRGFTEVGKRERAHYE